MKKFAKALSLLLVLAMVFSLAACGGGGGNNAANNNNAAPAEPRILKIATVKTINQAGFPTAAGTDQKVVATTVLESLGRYDDNGNIVGFLAKEIITKPDEPAIVLKLNEGIKYHDGTAFNAQAVCDVYDILKENGQAAQFSNVDSYKATGEYEVTIKLKQWTTDAVEKLCIGCGCMFSPTAFKQNGIDWMYTHMVGTGAFIQKEFTIGDKIVCEKNPDYWQPGLPYLDGITIYQFDDETAAMNALKTGDIRLIIYPNMQNYKSLLSAGFTRYGVDSCVSIAGVLGMFFASGKEGQDVTNLKVRQAICYAVNKEGLANAFTEGLGVVTEQLGVAGTRENNPAVKGYPYNPEKAKQLLAEAGFTADHPAEVTLTFPAAYQDIFTAVQKNLTDVGIKVNLDITDNIGDKITMNGADPYVSICWWSAPTTVSAWFRYYSASPFTMVRDALDLKAAGVIDLYDKIMTAKTPEEQKKLMDELAIKTVDELCLYCPFYHTLSYYIGDDTITGSNFGMQANTQWSPETTNYKD